MLALERAGIALMARAQKFSDSNRTGRQLIVLLKEDELAVGISSPGQPGALWTALDIHQMKRLRDWLIVETA